MRIYINFFPESLKNNFNGYIVTMLGKNNVYIEKNTYIELVSKELGIITIDSNQTIKHLEPNFHPVFEQLTNYENTKKNLLFDLTEYTYTTFVSRLPTDYIYLRVIEYSYRLSTISSKLVLKVKYIEEMDESHCIQLVPIDYYFEYTDDSESESKNLLVDNLLSNMFFKNDFNMFLSMLN